MHNSLKTSFLEKNYLLIAKRILHTYTPNKVLENQIVKMCFFKLQYRVTS